MATYGVTADGFLAKVLTDIVGDFEAALRGIFGESINLAASSGFSQFVGLVSDRLAEVWEVSQAVYRSDDPDEAEGASLDKVCAITGTVREDAAASTADYTATGTTGTSLPEGSVVSVVTIGTRFATLDAAVIAAATAWAITTAYIVGDIRKNSGNVYRCVTAGTSAGAGGPTTTDSDITDGTAHWRYLGAGDGYVTVACASENTGPLAALAYTLTEIETPVAGWSGGANILDAAVGRDVETDEALRVRREVELLGESESVPDAIRKALLVVDGVTAVTVFQNDTDATNADGMPRCSVECLVKGGTDQAVGEAVFQAVAAGITKYGNTDVTVIDEDNGDQEYTVSFSRADELEVYVIANVIADPDTFPSDGAAQVAAAILAQSYANGKNCVSSQLSARCFAVTGILDVDTLYIGLAPAPASEATLPVALRELAVLDSSRITVNVVDGVP